MTYHVREAIADDLDDLVRFTLAEAADAEGIALPADRVRRGVQTGLENPEIAHYWVLEDEAGSAVGSASVVREWSDWQAGWYWWVQSIYVEPGHRGKGAADLLLDGIRAAAHEAGAVDLRLYVHEGNAAALRFYRRYGFEDAPYRILRIAGRA